MGCISCGQSVASTVTFPSFPQCKAERKCSPATLRIETFRLWKATPSLSFSISKSRKAPKGILISVSSLWLQRWAVQCRSSHAYFYCSFHWCTICSIPSLISSPHSLLRKPLCTEFPTWLSDHSHFIQPSVKPELLLSRELKHCSSQACSSSLVTFIL